MGLYLLTPGKYLSIFVTFLLSGYSILVYDRMYRAEEWMNMALKSIQEEDITYIIKCFVKELFAMTRLRSNKQYL